MPTIGRKKKTKKQTKFKSFSPAMRKVINKKNPRISTGKRFQQFLKNYDEAIANGSLKPIKEIEELRDKWKDYWNKDGTPSKTKLKSKRKREEFNADMKLFNKKYRRWGKKAVQEMAEKRKERREKQAKTFGEREVERIKEEKEKAGENTEGVDFGKIAEQESKNYLAMLDIFAMDSFNKLREELNIGSRVVQVLASMGLSDDVIEGYLIDFRNAYKNIPREARDLAEQDDLNQAIIDLVELHGADNLTEVLSTYIKADGKEERDQVALAGEYHALKRNAGKTNTSFTEFWEEAHGTDFRKWGDFL